MIKMEIDQVAVNDVKKMLGEFSGKYKSVMVTSINKTLKTAQTQAVARIGNELNLKAARIKKDFTTQKANFSKISGAVVAKGKPVGLVQFGANQTLKGVSVKVLRSGSRELLKHAYIAARGTKEHVYWRSTQRHKHPPAKKFSVGKKARAKWAAIPIDMRRPVERLTGPRVEDIFAKDRVFDPVSIQAQHVYLQNVEAKVQEIIRRYG